MPDEKNIQQKSQSPLPQMQAALVILTLLSAAYWCGWKAYEKKIDGVIQENCK